MISPLFTTIVLTSCFIWLFMKFTTKKINESEIDYMERERQANLARKQSLDSLHYITINPDDFSVPDNIKTEQINDLLNTISRLSSQKIVNLTGITNTELKLNYGVANLNDLMEYDQNFTTLCRSIFDLGNILYNMEEKQLAKSILEKGISIGSDISANYIILADIYIELNQTENINQLIASAELLKSLTKNSTIDKLKNKIKENGGVILATSDGQVSSIPTISNGDNILPKDILDILETVPYKSDDQKP